MSLRKNLALGSSTVLLTAVLSGCVSLDERSTDTSTENVTTVTATLTSTAAAEPTTRTTVQSATEASTTAPVQCNLDPRTSDFGPSCTISHPGW